MCGCGPGGDDSGKAAGREVVLAPPIPDTPARAEPPRTQRSPAPKPRRARRSLTPAQLASQRVIFAFEGTALPQDLIARVRRGEAAGIILFGRNIVDAAQVKRLTGQLQAIPRPRWARAPLLVMTDQEGGQIVRIRAAASPSARALGAQGDPDRAFGAGQESARVLRSAGVNVNLAPVADVGGRGNALDKQERLFGSSARRVATMAGAFAAGLGDGGVAATAKHFPGFGAASSNTDNGPVSIDRRADALRRTDLRPFTQMVREGVPLVMLSTAAYPALATGPAALSPAVAGRLLRREVGFEGVSVTDDLETPALAAYGPASSVAPRAAAAGNDLLLFAKTYAAGDAAARALTSGLQSGALRRSQAEASAERVLRLRSSLGTGR